MSVESSFTIEVFPPARQGRGQFDNGKITEIKPIDFPGGLSDAKRIGPLLYWAWASANGDGVIGMHPHQGFEIMSYVLEGEVGHSDTLKNRMRVGTGGVQVMQTGSGVYHQEEMFGERTQFFQIWFEPNLREAIQRDPVYKDFNDEDFPRNSTSGGVEIKTILGGDSPISLVVDAKMIDVSIQPEKTHELALEAGHSLAAVAVSGSGSWSGEAEAPFATKDFTIIKANDHSEITIEAGTDELRLVIIDVPQKVDYPFFT